MSNTYLESANTLPIYDECDLLVVGGGAAGHSAAVAAARAGVEKVILMERYGYFGGDVTGDYVLMVPGLSWRNYSMVRGLQEEWFTRLDKNAPGSYISPSLEDIGKNTPILLDRWSLVHGCISHDPNDKYLIRAPYFEPTQLKLEMDAMIQELPNIKPVLHSWGTKPIMDGNTIRGVIFESKEGRKAIMAKIVIDATGDGDLYAQAGAPHHTKSGIPGRDDQSALVWRAGGVDYEAFARWQNANPAIFKSFREELDKIAGFKTMFYPTDRNDVVWFNNWLTGMNCINLEHIKETEFRVRNTIRPLLEFCREAVPFAFHNAFIYDIAPQFGARCSRRLDGEYYMTPLDFAVNREFDDVIAWHSTVLSDVPVEIPYRSILPKKVENLLAPGRHIAADPIAIIAMQLVPQCVGTGQAAGVAAAVALKEGKTTHNVDIKKVQKILCMEQDVPLPRQENTNPKLLEDLKACNYGRDTERSQRIRKAAGLDW